MTVAEAAAAIRAGQRVRVVVGTAPDDPTLIAYAHEGMVISESVAGWSEGVVEPVCRLDSEYLTRRFLAGRRLERA